MSNSMISLLKKKKMMLKRVELLESVDVGDAFDLLSLAEQLSDLTAQLLELLNRHCHADAPILLRKQLKVNLGTQNSRTVIR